MPDITQIEGPAGGPDNVRRQDRSIPDDKFKKAMEPKVTKVTESDADQEAKKKKKSKQEDGVEGEDQVAAGPPPEQPLPSPFSLESAKKMISPSELQAGEGKISPLESAQKRAPSPMEAFVEQPPAYTPPSSEEIEDDSGIWGETAEIQQSPAPTPPPPIAAQPPQTPGAPPVQPQEAVRPETPAPTQPQQPSQPTSSSTAPSQSVQGQKTSPSASASPQASPQQITPQAGQAPVQPSAPQDASELLKQMPEEAPLIGQIKPSKPLTPTAPTAAEKVEEEIEGAQGIAPVTPTLSPTGASLESDKKKERTSTDTVQAGSALPSEAHIPIETPLVPPEAPIASYLTLTPQVMDLFERMVGVMTVMNSEGLTETTVTLNTPQFASSVFYGTQIIIQEYSTAPKAFNIQIKGTPAAVAAFQGNTNDLMAAFQHGNYNFRVNRLDTSLLDERPLFKRKDKISNDPDDQPE